MLQIRGLRNKLKLDANYAFFGTRFTICKRKCAKKSGVEVVLSEATNGPGVLIRAANGPAFPQEHHVTEFLSKIQTELGFPHALKADWDSLIDGERLRIPSETESKSRFSHRLKVSEEKVSLQG